MSSPLRTAATTLLEAYDDPIPDASGFWFKVPGAHHSFEWYRFENALKGLREATLPQGLLLPKSRPWELFIHGEYAGGHVDLANSEGTVLTHVNRAEAEELLRLLGERDQALDELAAVRAELAEERGRADRLHMELEGEPRA